MGRGRIDRRPQFRPEGRQQKGGDARMKRNLLVLAGKVPRANSRRNSDQGEIDEALFNTAKLTSWLLDMSLPVERGGLNEVHYDIVCVYSGDELPEEGTVMLADPELEFAWQTEQVWQLSGRNTPGCKSYGIKRGLKSYGTAPSARRATSALASTAPGTAALATAATGSARWRHGTPCSIASGAGTEPAEG